MTPKTPLPTRTAQELLRDYKGRGFRVVFYKAKTKGPKGIDAEGWTQRDDQPEDYHDGDNVGVLTGVEIQSGKFLVDVDFDWTEGLELAKRILPATEFAFGRDSKDLSHAFYTTSTPQESREYTDIDGKNFVELRGTKLDGSIGLQTMLPPSIHPSGEIVELKLKGKGEIVHDDGVPRRVLLFAIACALWKHLGERAFNHDTRLCTAGFLLRAGLSEEEVIAIGEAVATKSGNDVSDVATTVRSTAARVQSGEHVSGKRELTRAIGEDGKKVVARIREWLGSDDFIRDDKENVRANSQENIRRALDKLNVRLSFDRFAQKSLITYLDYNGILQDVIVNRLRLETETQFKFLPPKEHFFDVVQDLAHKRQFHPVLDYLRSLEWDGTSRLDTWLIKSAKAGDTKYTRAVSSIVLKAAVRRVTQPGCKFDEMVVLESGTQGLEKSTALRTLCPKEEWFSDDLPLNVEAKEIIERTLGKWLIEASDLSGMSEARIEHLKGMLSRQIDGPVRMAYARVPIEQRRQFVVIGTTNSYSYLLDSTGNRRFWPVRVEKFDIGWIRENRDQLWAEAACREAAGESIRLPPELYEDAALQQDRRRVGDSWEDRLGNYFAEEYQRVAYDEVWEVLGIPIERQDGRQHKRVSQVMQRLGFVRKTVVDRKKNKVWGWARGTKGLDYEGE